MSATKNLLCLDTQAAAADGAAMGCLDNRCRDCGEIWTDNGERPCCPICGSRKVRTSFDEAIDLGGDSNV